ncbi:helix-turn-helix transcriptional regulator [bacterium]|nr:helix-turn-helix transcriptional regulator [bacterium]
MNTNILIKLGKQLKIIRKEKGLTQEQLAEKVGIHPTYVGKLESGKSNLSTLLLFKISRALGVKLSKIFEFDK